MLLSHSDKVGKYYVNVPLRAEISVLQLPPTLWTIDTTTNRFQRMGPREQPTSLVGRSYFVGHHHLACVDLGSKNSPILLIVS